MNFLTDENISLRVAKYLREKCFDVKDIKEEKLYGLSDEEIFEIAVKEKRAIITHDKDFVNIARNSNQHHSGIILVKPKNLKPENVLSLIESLLNSEAMEKIKGNTIILTDEQITVIQS